MTDSYTIYVNNVKTTFSGLDFEGAVRRARELRKSVRNVAIIPDRVAS